MLSGLLRSDVAVNASINIMRTFVEMRKFIANNAAMFERIGAIELRQLEYQKQTDERFDKVFGLLETKEEPDQKIFFDGQIYDAFDLIVKIIREAKEDIILIDGYADIETLNILAKKKEVGYKPRFLLFCEQLLRT